MGQACGPASAPSPKEVGMNAPRTKCERGPQLYRRLRNHLMRTSASLHHELRSFLSTHELTPAQLEVLQILRDHSSRSMSTLCLRSQMNAHGPDTPRLVDRLLQKGLVSKDTCCDDRRRLEVTISQQGLALLRAIESKMTGLDAAFARLSEGEARQLDALLVKLGRAQKD